MLGDMERVIRSLVVRLTGRVSSVSHYSSVCQGLEALTARDAEKDAGGPGQRREVAFFPLQSQRLLAAEDEEGSVTHESSVL